MEDAMTIDGNFIVLCLSLLALVAMSHGRFKLAEKISISLRDFWWHKDKDK
jgi:hypothetical protein